FQREFGGMLPGFLEESSNFHDLAPKVGDAHSFRGIWTFGMIHARRNVQPGRGVSDRGAVISGAAGNHAGKFAVHLFLTNRDGVIRAANLEGSSRAFTFEFEID